MEKLYFNETLAHEKGQYKIKSKKDDDDSKRYWYCPFTGCGNKFPNARTADSCLNKHLGLVYNCKTCEFISHNYDSARNHKCFAYRGGGEKTKKRKGGNVKTSGGKEEDESVVAKKIKIEKGNDEEEVIVLE